MSNDLKTKDLFLNTQSCPTLGWHCSHSESSEPASLIDQLRMEEGIQIHQRARDLFPEGFLITGDNQLAHQRTQEIISKKHFPVILNGTFIADGYIAKTDILIREHTGWKFVEVTSSTNKNSDHTDEMAYKVMVAQRAGLKINECSLYTVSKDYRLGMPDNKLFEEHDCTDSVFEKVNDFEQHWDEVANILNSTDLPASKQVWICKKCGYHLDCFGIDISDTVFEIPYLREADFLQLQQMGVFHICDIPENFALNNYQYRAKRAVLTQQSVIDIKNIRQELDSIVFPAYYLDFETMMTCLPPYPDVAPYTQITTQYSVHVCKRIGEITEHKEYLADPSSDCRRELAERMIQDCGNKGSVIVYYASFERGRIKSMIEWFPDLENKLTSILNRIIDLHEIVRNYYYHPEFHGSTSIKVALPVMVPELSYKGMNIGDGSLAMAVFANMVKGKYQKQEIEQLRSDLLEYCKMDTLAMVRLHEKLQEIV